MAQENKAQQNEQAWDNLLESAEGSDLLKKLAEQAKQDLKEGNVSSVDTESSDKE